MHRSIPTMALALLIAFTAFGDQSVLEHWTFDTLEPFKVHGKATPAEGTSGKCQMLDGQSLIEVKHSTTMTQDKGGFTLTVWVNVQALDRGQQMIAAKNRYALGEREWSLMLDEDNVFRLYVWQGKWATVSANFKPRPGQWHQVGIVIQPKRAAIWTDGGQRGSIRLEKPLPKTKAPLTFGGVNDDGFLRQHWLGAIDEARLDSRPLTDQEMEAAYTPVTQTLPVPAPLPPPPPLWDESKPLGRTGELAILDGVTFHVIKPYEFKQDGYRFLHGVALAWHKGRLFASFGHNKGGENTVSEEARYRVSADGGKTWGPVRTIDAGTKDLAVSHGVFHSHAGRLWAFHGAYSGTMQNVHTRAYRFSGSGAWDDMGVVAKGGFWPMLPPVPMNDGNWIMPGLIVGQGNPSGVAISHGNDFLLWDLVRIPKLESTKMWGESGVLLDGPQVLNISRYGGKSKALVSVSRDYGRTWSLLRESNLPMVTAKPCTGTLSNGQRYLIATTTADSGSRRSPLTIAVSRSGKNAFSRVFVIRHASFPEGPGESHPQASLAYPYAVEHEGKLYVGYSNDGGKVGRVGKGRELWNNNSAELAIIPIKSLAW